MKPCKYRFKTMQVGDIWYVTGVNTRHAQQAWYRTAKRNPEIAGRQFLWVDVNCGVKVERVG